MSDILISTLGVPIAAKGTEWFLESIKNLIVSWAQSSKGLNEKELLEKIVDLLKIIIEEEKVQKEISNKTYEVVVETLEFCKMINIKISNNEKKYYINNSSDLDNAFGILEMNLDKSNILYDLFPYETFYQDMKNVYDGINEFIKLEKERGFD